MQKNPFGREENLRLLNASMKSNAFRPESNTSSLDSGFLQRVWIHNIEFQQYSIDNQVYFAPVGEDEVERNDIMHNVLQRVFDGRLIFPPITRPRRVLDCGYGTSKYKDPLQAPADE